jgi:hypothetical protein
MPRRRTAEEEARLEERDCNRHATTRKKYNRKPIPRPEIDPKCWTEDDLQFWMTGEYDMVNESPDVQVMLDMASMLTAARVEWMMASVRTASHCGGQSEAYREPRHAQNKGWHHRASTITKD